MKETRIQDIPSIKKTLDDIRNFSQLKAAWPLLRWFFDLIGVKVEQVDEAFSKLDELKREMEEFATIPDQFNDLFALRGWIAYGLLNVDIAKAAIAKAKIGDIDGAENLIVDYYSPETVQWKLRTLNGVRAFRPRMRLARLALVDYQEGRYHASTPVILALLDGLVNDLHKPKKGFFADGVKLEAWDSIAAHSKGLSVLADIFRKGRYETTEVPISIPYRNGILHGMDLGYDNKMVAAKAWAALFAVRDWALKAEQNKLSAQPEKASPTWKQVFQQLQQNAETKAQLQDWRPRSAIVCEGIPKTGEPEDFSEGTPERRLVEYLHYWKKRNFGFMAKYTEKSVGYSEKAAPAYIREEFEAKRLISFEFIAITDEAPAITVIQTKLLYEQGGTNVEKIVKFRMINEDVKGKPAVSGASGSVWVIYNWAI